MFIDEGEIGIAYHLCEPEMHFYIFEFIFFAPFSMWDAFSTAHFFTPFLFHYTTKK